MKILLAAALLVLPGLPLEAQEYPVFRTRNGKASRHHRPAVRVRAVVGAISLTNLRSAENPRPRTVYGTSGSQLPSPESGQTIEMECHYWRGPGCKPPARPAAPSL